MKPAGVAKIGFTIVFSCFTCLASALLLVTLAATSVSTAAADSDAADAAKTVLEGKGLRKIGLFFSLTDETEVRRRLREAELLQKKVREAQRESAACEQNIEEKRQLIIDYSQQRRELRARLDRAGSVRAHNQIVNALNELGDRMVLLQQDESAAKAAESARAVLETAQSQYVEEVLKTRALYDEIIKKYADLKADAAVAEAVAAFNKNIPKPCELGPARAFAGLEAKLKKIEDTVLREEIDLEKGGGNLWMVPVVFNDGKMQKMAIDTGASIIALPWNVAVAIDMAPTADDPVMQVQMADGRTVAAVRKTAAKVRLGKFTAENVECAVMPKEFTEAAPLLGLSFLKHFTFKIDTANAKLIMSQVESGEKTLRKPR